MENNFYCGVVCGLIVAGILGIILGEIREARNRMGARNRPLDTFPDAIQPHRTPAGIVRSSTMAMFSCLFWTGLLIVAILAFIAVIPYIGGTP